MKLPFQHSAPKKYNLVLIHNHSGNALLHYAVISGQTTAHDLVSFESMEEILKKADKTIPFIIHVRGAGILARSVENAPNYKERLLVSGREDEFYFNSYERSGSILVSFARKNVIDEFLQPIEAAKGFIWALYIGPSILPFRVEKLTTIQSDYVLAFPTADQVILSKNEQELSEKQVLTAYTEAIINYTFQKHTHPDPFYQAIDEETFQKTKSNYKDFRQFRIIGLSILGFFLITLTVNYFVVNHLNQVAVDYEEEIAGYQDNFAVIDRIKQEKQRKLVLFQNSGMQSRNLLSYYADEIGVTVPKDIQFTEMELFPLAQQLKPKHKVETDNSRIIIHGITLNSKILDDWMEDLEKKEWVQSVEVINYSRLDDRNSIFHIIIHIRE
ncbi:hypothetical protein [Fluviicola sp.]|uniref:hypothetical protein n=1 Tax=Fluviicola sp. TaxID=1917219 RepID=UPI0031DF38AB